MSSLQTHKTASFTFVATLRTRGAIIFQPFSTFRTMSFLFNFLLNIRMCIYGPFYSIIYFLQCYSFIHMYCSIMALSSSPPYTYLFLRFKAVLFYQYIFSILRICHYFLCVYTREVLEFPVS
jgi:hypothetical protein